MIDTKALRSRILDLAIQGKLTEQLPNDGTAEELYQQIQAEKQALIKEGKIKKEKPLPEISADEIPFEIPQNWKWVRLQEIVTLLGDGIHGTPKYDENGKYYFINGNNLCNGVIEIKPNTKRIDYDEFLKYKKELNDNTVLVSINGTLGNLAFYNNEKVILGKSACYFNLVKKEMKVYIYYLLKTDYFLKYANYTATGVTIRNVSLKAMNELFVPLPPLAEQKRIVERVEEIFRLLDTIDEAQEKYSADVESLKEILFTVAIQGKLTKQLESDGTASELYNDIQAEKEVISQKGELYREKSIKPVKQTDIPYDIPKSWIWVRLGELAQVVTKGSSPKWQGVNYTDSENGILFVTSENVGNGCLLLDKRKYIEKPFNEMHPSSILKKGDILTNIVGASIGRTAIFDEDIEDANINQAVCVVRLINPDMSDYILRYLCSKDAIRLMLGKVVDTARANLSLTAVANLMVPLPPLAEQKRIADVLERALGELGKG